MKAGPWWPLRSKFGNCELAVSSWASVEPTVEDRPERVKARLMLTCRGGLWVRVAQPASQSGSGSWGPLPLPCRTWVALPCLKRSPFGGRGWNLPLGGGIFPTLRFIFSVLLKNLIWSSHMLIFLLTGDISSADGQRVSGCCHPPGL